MKRSAIFYILITVCLLFAGCRETHIDPNSIVAPDISTAQETVPTTTDALIWVEEYYEDDFYEDYLDWEEEFFEDDLDWEEEFFEDDLDWEEEFFEDEFYDEDYEEIEDELLYDE